MMHPETEVRVVNQEIGYGVFAKVFIPKGTMVYVKDQFEVRLKEGSLLLNDPRYKEISDKYSYIDAAGTRIISWDHAKYVNHCCNPNTMTTGYGFEIAIKDIQIGDEITDEYGLFNLEREMPLSCKSKPCRLLLSPNDFEKMYPVWDEKVQAALASFNQVEQPLLNFLDRREQKALMSYLNSGKGYRSVYTQKKTERATRARRSGTRDTDLAIG